MGVVLLLLNGGILLFLLECYRWHMNVVFQISSNNVLANDTYMP